MGAARTVAVVRARAGTALPPRFTVGAFGATAALAAGILLAAVRLAHA